jgi:hypothetical protein
MALRLTNEENLIHGQMMIHTYILTPVLLPLRGDSTEPRVQYYSLPVKLPHLNNTALISDHGRVWTEKGL